MATPTWPVGSKLDLYAPVKLFPSLFALCTTGPDQLQNMEEGEYTVVDIGRDAQLWHDQEFSDGFYYWLSKDEHIRGWEWQNAIVEMSGKARSEDYATQYPAPDQFDLKIPIGSKLKIRGPLPHWRLLNNASEYDLDELPDGDYRVRVEDAGYFNTENDKIDEALGRAFVVYRLSGVPGTQFIWVPEAYLSKFPRAKTRGTP